MSKLNDIMLGIEKNLDAFLAQKNMQDTDRSDHLVWSYQDKVCKKTLCIIFSRNHLHGESTNEFDLEAGYVLVVPNFWINTPKPLTMEYLLDLISSWYRDALKLSYSEDEFENGRTPCGCYMRNR